MIMLNKEDAFKEDRDAIQEMFLRVQSAMINSKKQSPVKVDKKYTPKK